MALGLKTRLLATYEKLHRSPKLINQYLASHPVRKVQIGCGENVLEGWLNCDLDPKADDVVAVDVTQRFPFEDRQFDYLFSEHVIEHFDYLVGKQILQECFRVLKPNGKVRIVTPGLAFLVGLYAEKKSDLQKRYIDWAAKSFVDYATEPRAAFVINNFFYCDWGHRFIYDEETLGELMSACGFANITYCQLGQSEDPQLAGLEYQNRMPPGFLKLESIIVEAIKPAEATIRS
jgi:predicted SAM-dependent methyltransferase